MPKSRFRLIGFLALLLWISPHSASPATTTQPSGPHIILIIRHAEKPDPNDAAPDINLSKRGYQRADALARTIPDHFPRPDFLLATKQSKSSNRPIETITPLAAALHEKIEAEFKDDEFNQAAHEVLTNPKYVGKTVLIAWHHGKIPELAKALGAKDVPDKWDPNVFDRVWEITYDAGVATWKDLPQNALPGDSQK